MQYWTMGGPTPADIQRVQEDLQGELKAAQQYAQHIAGSQNPALQRLWHRIRQDELRHAHWLRMALSGHVPGGGMGQMGAMEQMMGHMMQPQTSTDQTSEMQTATARFRPGDVVVPLVAHMPEYAGNAARVVQVVQNQPFYAVDFGNGHPHRWYAQDELQPAPPGVVPGQVSI